MSQPKHRIGTRPVLEYELKRLWDQVDNLKTRRQSWFPGAVGGGGFAGGSAPTLQYTIAGGTPANFIPLTTRMMVDAHVYFDDPFFVCAVKPGADSPVRGLAQIAPGLGKADQIDENYGGLLKFRNIEVGTEDTMGGFFYVPKDWSGGAISLNLWFRSLATGNMSYGFSYRCRGAGSVDNSFDYTELGQTIPLTSNVLAKLTKAISADYIEPDSVVIFALTRQSTLPQDTIEGDVFCRGSDFLYSCPPDDQYSSFLSLHNDFGYGTYQWKAKISGVGGNNGQIVGLFEHHHGYSNDGIIMLWCNKGTYIAETGWGDACTTTVLTGQDWTVERTFKVIWSASEVKYYVDDVLVATHITNVPQEPMNLFAEAWRVGGKSTSFAKVFFHKSSFVKLA